MVTSGFFNSVNGDRKYSAEQMSAIFNGIINDGVFVNVGTAFAVTVDVGNTVLVGPGRAWIDSTWIYNDVPLPIELEDSDILTDRIDAIVLETDHSAPVRMGSIKVIKGVAQTNPVRPTMEHSFYVNQYPIAYILRSKNSTSITQANITYMVGTSELPFVTGILETLDIDALVAQWGAEWKEWFDAIKAATSGDIVEYQEAWDEWFQNVKDELSEDAAGNLQTQIYELESRQAVAYGTMSTAGWYRVATCPVKWRSKPRASSIITIKRSHGNTPNSNEIIRLALFTDAVNISKGIARFELLNSFTNKQLIDKIQCVEDMSDIHIDIHYVGSDDDNIVTVIIDDGFYRDTDQDPDTWGYFYWQPYRNPITAYNIVFPASGVLAEYDIQPNVSGDMSRFGIKTVGTDILSLGGFFAGDIDELKPASIQDVNPFCGTYICSTGITDGSIPTEFPVDDSAQPIQDVCFLLNVDATTNGRVQYAYPFTYTRTSDDDPKFAVRCLSYLDDWSEWAYIGGGAGSYLPLSGGDMSGSIDFPSNKGINFRPNAEKKFSLYTTEGGTFYMDLHSVVNGSPVAEHVFRSAVTNGYVSLYKNLYIRDGFSLHIQNSSNEKFWRFLTDGGGSFRVYDTNQKYHVILEHDTYNVHLYSPTSKNSLIFHPGNGTNDSTRLTLYDGGGTDKLHIQIPSVEIYPNDIFWLQTTNSSTMMTVQKRTEAGVITSHPYIFGFEGELIATKFNTSSSALVKENVKDLTEEEVLKILDLRPVSFDFIEGHGGKDQIGLIAEEVLEHIPQVVSIPNEIDVEGGKVPSIDYSKLVAPLIKLVQMQQERIDEQDRKIDDLENRVAYLEEIITSIIHN